MPWPVSEWYSSLGSYTFPTVFIRLREAEIEAFLNCERQSAATKRLVAKLDYVIEHLPGACFVHADTCAPTDALLFEASDGAVKRGRDAWNLLQESEKVKAAVRERQTERFAMHPFRRMDHGREFRLFFKDGVLRAMSQRFLERYHARLHRRQARIWEFGKELAGAIAEFLPHEDIVVDVYLTSTDRLMILDLNPWGAPTEPLLLRTWEQDWTAEIGLKLLPKPIKLKGDVSISC